MSDTESSDSYTQSSDSDTDVYWSASDGEAAVVDDADDVQPYRFEPAAREVDDVEPMEVEGDQQQQRAGNTEWCV